MVENTATDTVNDDDLADEALDRTSGGKFPGAPLPGASFGPACRAG